MTYSTKIEQRLPDGTWKVIANCSGLDDGINKFRELVLSNTDAFRLVADAAD